MTSDSTRREAIQPATLLLDDWFDPIEASLRGQVRGFIETLLDEELSAALSRPRYGRRAMASAAGAPGACVVGHRHGRRLRSLAGTFGRVELEPCRAPGWWARTARRASGGAGRCGPTSAGRGRPTR